MSPEDTVENTGAHSYRWHLALALLAAAAVRILWASQVNVVPISDSHAYDVFARNLLDYGVFGWTKDAPYAFWPPGTSLLYAAVYGLFGKSFSNIVALNVVLSCALLVTTFRVARRFYGNKVAIASAWVLALWPTLVMFTTILASELPFLLLTIGALDAWSMPGRSWLLKGIGAGALLGAAALVRPFALALPIVFAASFCLSGPPSKGKTLTQLKMALACVLTMACVIAPWTWRNYRLYGEPVLISTNGGITLWMGNSEGSNGDYRDIPERLRGLNDNEQSRILGAEAKAYILAHPLSFATQTLRKVVQLYSNESIGVTWNADGIQQRYGSAAVTILKRFTQLSWALIFILAGLGVFSLIRRQGWRALVSPIVSSVAFYTLVHGVIVSQDRYHLAFASQLAILAGVGILLLLRKKLVVEPLSNS